MNNFEEYLQMKEESKQVNTEREIDAFVRKYRWLPNGMINELQAKLDIINQDNKAKGIGVCHIIHKMSEDEIENES